jgi:hypothetical protein
MAFSFTRIFAATVALTAGLACAIVVGLGSSRASTPAANLTGGQTITSGGEIASSDGHYLLTMSATGDLEEQTTGGRVVWSSGTSGNPGAYAVMQPNGNLVVETPGEVLWSTNTNGTGCPSLSVMRDGSMAIYDPTASLWSSPLSSVMGPGDILDAGWVVIAPNREYELTMTSTGYLEVISNAGTVVWQSDTTASPGAYAEMQANGDLVVYSSSGIALWSSNTTGDTGATLDLLSTGELELYSTANKSVWSSGKTGSASATPLITTPGTPGSTTPCPAAPVPTTTTVTVVSTATVVSTVQAPSATETVPNTKAKTRLHVPVSVKWSWSGAVTKLDWLRVGKLPKGGKLLVTVKLPGKHGKTYTKSATTTKTVKAAIVWLEANHYLPGDVVTLEITRRGYISEQAIWKIRRANIPTLSSH